MEQYTIIPYGKQHITDEDIKAVVDTLQSSHLTQGPKITEFEESFSKYTGSTYSVAVSNGTAALHLAVMTLGLGPGDKVITTPITFAASANCIRYCGAEVVFADIDPESYLIDISEVRKILKADTKKEIKGIIPVQFAGRMVNMEILKKLADEFNLWIVEDACHAPGAYFFDSKGTKQYAGNGLFADMSVFSFHPVKHIACGEGGLVSTNNTEYFHQLNRLRSHGITKGDDIYVNGKDFANAEPNEDTYPGWYMEMQYLGFNYRITDIQAALGNSQLKLANERLLRRRIIAKKYDQAFSTKEYILGHSQYHDGHAYHLYVIEVKDRLGLYNFLRENKVYAQVHYIPTHLMPYYRGFGWKEGDFPNAEGYYKNCLSLPMFPTLTEDEQSHVINLIEQYYNE